MSERPTYLAHLNDEQYTAATAPIDRPTLVIAGAGSGKTSTLIARLLHLVNSGVSHHSIAAMTFTRKAAEEMGERLPFPWNDRIGLTTIHAFGYQRLKAHRASRGLAPLRVVDMKKALRNLSGKPWGEWREAINGPTMDLSFVTATIGSWREDRITPAEAITIYPERSPEWWIARLYGAYNGYKQRTNQVDFDDMLYMLLEHYHKHPDALDQDRTKYTHGLVDELQDTSAGQWELIRMLWEGQPLFGVGDPRQAIYEWRGARPAELLAFTRHWPDAVVVNLATNYRSVPEIITAASNLMQGTPEDEASDPLVPHRESIGRLPEVRYFEDANGEAGWVASDIRKHWGDVEAGEPAPAILYRTNAQSAAFEMMLSAFDIPYQVRGGSFWNRFEIKALMGYVRFAANPNDPDALRRSVMAPSRYLGQAYVDAVIDVASTQGTTLLEAVTMVSATQGKRLHGGQLQAARDYAATIRLLQRWTSPADQLHRVLTNTNFRDWLVQTEGSSDGADDNRLAAVEMLLETAAQYQTASELIRYVEEQEAGMDEEPDPTRVQLLTVHRSKGLEWPTVYVAGFIEDVLPHKNGEEEEERRLAYVAITRARDRLVVCCPGEPSDYLFQAGLIDVREAGR